MKPPEGKKEVEFHYWSVASESDMSFGDFREKLEFMLNIINGEEGYVHFDPSCGGPAIEGICFYVFENKTEQELKEEREIIEREESREREWDLKTLRQLKAKYGDIE